MYVCMYVYMYSFFYGTFTSRARTFQAGGVALTNVTDSSIAHTHCGTKGNIKEKAGTGERSQTLSVGIQKRRSKVRGTVNLKL